MTNVKAGAKSIKTEFACQRRKVEKYRVCEIFAKSRIFEFATGRRKVDKNRVCDRRTHSYTTYRVCASARARVCGVG